MTKLELTRPSIKTYTYDEALAYVKSFGYRLPTKEELEEAIAAGQDLGKASFWSSSVHPSTPTCAYFFNGITRDIDTYTRNSLIAIRAIPVEEKAPPKPKTNSEVRKNSPVFSGVLMYFPEAIMEVSRHSKRGNDKHNPGQPLHWAKEKSKDHADCIARHLIDIGPNWDAIDSETGSLHAAALAWRALALLQTVLDKKKVETEYVPTVFREENSNDLELFEEWKKASTESDSWENTNQESGD